MRNTIIRTWELLVQREFTKFLLVGVINTFLAYAVYIVVNIFMSYTMAYVIAYLTGFLSSYFLNSKWVFQTDVSWKKFLTYPLVYIVQFLINLVCLRALVEEFSVSETVAPVIVIVISIPITFVLVRFFLNRPEKSSTLE